MELGLIVEAPPWTLPRRAHKIMSIWWGTTTSPATRVMGLRPIQPYSCIINQSRSSHAYQLHIIYHTWPTTNHISCQADEGLSCFLL